MSVRVPHSHLIRHHAEKSRFVRIGAASGRSACGAFLLAVLALSLVPVHVAAQSDARLAAVVFGSFGTADAADTARNELEARLREPLDVHKVLSNGVERFRVTTRLDRNATNQRARMASWADLGIDGLWLIYANPAPAVATSKASPGLDTTSVPTPLSLRARAEQTLANLDALTREPVSSTATAATTAASQQVPAPTIPAQAVKAPVPTPAMRTFGMLPGHTRTPGASDRSAVEKDEDSPNEAPAPDTLILTPAAPTGVDATSAPIVLPRVDDVEIKVDGRLDEAVWSRVPGYDNMSVLDPDTLAKPVHKTDVLFVYTNKGLYVGVKAEQPADKLVMRLSSRDGSINRDGVSLTLDTSGEGLYGQWYGVNVGGSIIDGKVLPEAEFSTQWDGPWTGNSVQTDYGYSAEMFLPWSMMSMPSAGVTRKMGFYISRKVAYLDERWGWPALPRTSPRFMSALQPIELHEVNPRQQISLYPFTATTYDILAGEADYRTGLDVFWRPSSNLQLAATLNPDFGTVESDDVVVNLTSFETFFPEKRLFFLEGGEIFETSPRSNVLSQGPSSGGRRTKSNFNPTPTTLLNTRRIGGPAPDPIIPDGVSIKDVDLGKPTELLGAFKATGQTGGFRFGLLSAFEDDTTYVGTDAAAVAHQVEQTGRDFGAVRLMYESAGSSRKAVGWMSTAVLHESQDALVHGLDGHFLNSSGALQLDGQLLYSDVGNIDGYGGFVDVAYKPKRGYSHQVVFDYLDRDLNVDDFGFIRRNDAINFRYSFNHTTSAFKGFRNIRSSVSYTHELNLDKRPVRLGLFTRSTLTLHNLSSINGSLIFFPGRWDDRNSRGNGVYKIEDRWASEWSWGSNTGLPFSYSIGGSVQQEELGDPTYEVKTGFTFKPTDRFSFDLDLIYRRRHNWLVYQQERDLTAFHADEWHPQVVMDVFFSARQQLRFTMQWAGIKADEQSFWAVPPGDGELVPVAKDPLEPTDDFTLSRLTAQLRYRWEIAPLSDLFVVFTRGSNIPNRIDDSFDQLLRDAATDPIIDLLVVKLRYRFGT